jgi:type IV pilus assembly protein PilN
VTSIEPQVTKEGDVNIRLRVSGDRDRAVLLVRNLETSQRFLSPRLSSEQAQTQEGNRGVNAPATVPGAVQFEILSGYNPLPVKVAKETSAGKEDDSTKAPVAAKKGKPANNAVPHAVPGSGVVKAPVQKGAPR